MGICLQLIRFPSTNPLEPSVLRLLVGSLVAESVPRETKRVNLLNPAKIYEEHHYTRVNPHHNPSNTVQL